MTDLIKFQHNLKLHRFVDRKARTDNSTFAIGGGSCSADRFVVAESAVHRINICGENPAHRKSAKRYFTNIQNNATIDISELSSGLYFLIIELSNGTIINKQFIKQ